MVVLEIPNLLLQIDLGICHEPKEMPKFRRADHQ